MERVGLPEALPSARMPVLQAWLDRVQARRIWVVDVPTVGELSAYFINAHLVLVLRYGKAEGEVSGFEIFHPSSKTNRVDSSLDAVAVFCEAQGCRDLILAEEKHGNDQTT